VLRTLYNYVMSHLVNSLAALLSKPFKDAGKEFLKVLTGTLVDVLLQIAYVRIVVSFIGLA